MPQLGHSHSRRHSVGARDIELLNLAATLCGYDAKQHQMFCRQFEQRRASKTIVSILIRSEVQEQSTVA